MKPAPRTPILLQVGRRRCRRTPRAFVELAHRDEQRADHRRRFLRAKDLREIAALDRQREIHRQLQALEDALQDGLARRDNCRRFRGDRSHWPAARSSCRRGRRRCRSAALNFGSSQGALASGLALTQSLARCDDLAGRRDIVDESHRLGRAGRNCSPLNSICNASAVGIRRATRCVPPAPGNRPTLISGRPRRVFSPSATIR